MFKKFGGLPCVQGASEVLAGAEQSELLKLMIGMVKHCVLAEVFLELAKQACCKAWLLFKVFEDGCKCSTRDGVIPAS